MNANELKAEIERRRGLGHHKYGCLYVDHDAYVGVLEQYIGVLEEAIEGETAAYQGGYEDGYAEALR